MRDSAGSFQNVCTTEQDVAMVNDYLMHYNRLDRLRQSAEAAPASTILMNAMIVPQSEFVRTEFYADFAPPHDAHDAIEAHIFADPGCSGYVGLARSSRAGARGDEDVRLLRLLLPHMRRAMRTQLRLVTLGIERDIAMDALDRLIRGC